VTRINVRPLTMICAQVFEKSETCDPKFAPPGTPLVARVFEGKTIAPDAKVAAVLKPYDEQVAAKRLEPLGVRATANFTRSYDQESSLGNLLADLMREGTGADVAFMNSGGIRADLHAGDLKYGDIFEVSPFDNYPAIVTMTGAQLVEMIRRNLGGSHGTLQPSGLHYSYDASIPDRDPARLVSVNLANGNPIDPSALYKVALPDFLANGGGGLMAIMSAIPPERKHFDMSAPLRDLFVTVLKKRKEPLTPKMEGRITVVNEKRSNS
jgi:5'-nucleotidase